jgi:cytochrome b involved in lipid metabolism
LGDILPLVAGVLFVIALAWFLLDRRATAAGQPAGAGVTILGIVAALAALGTIGLTVAVGHSGAEAVWAGKVSVTSSEVASPHEPNGEVGSPADGTIAAGSSAAAAPAAHSVSPAVKRYTRAQVRRHNTATDCWTIIGRSVYNLTDWVNRHPGGASRIIALCGRDGTQAFRAQHGGQSRPASELATFRIGRLATTTSA